MNGPRVRSQAEYGYEGALAQTQRYGKPAVDRWRRMGGRKPLLTWTEVQLLGEPARPLTSRIGSFPGRTAKRPASGESAGRPQRT